MNRSTFRLAWFFSTMVLAFEGTSGGSGTQSQRPSIRGNQPFRIYPSTITQTEPFIVRHPTNPAILFVSANTINPANGFVSEGIYVSADSGGTWRGTDTCGGAPITFHRGDPAIAIDPQGTFILVRLGFSPGLFAHNSTDNGRTWSSQRTIATNDQDRGSLQSDVATGSSFSGRTYSSWVRLAPPYPVFFSYSDNGGTNWSTPVQINSPVQRNQGAELSIGPNGRVHVCWAAVTATSPYTEDFVGFATSTSGGASWTVSENAYDVNGIQGVLPQKSNIRVNGLPKIDTDRSSGARNGWIYIVTTERNLAPAGSDPDIILHRSTNNGQSWLAGIRVNQDALNNGKTQFFPALHVDDGGGVNVLYYDDRNTTTDSAAVYLSRSTDGGTTWTDHRIGNRNFKPTPIGGLGQGYQGDNVSLSSIGSTLWPVWMDNSSGIYQVWTCPIEISLLDVTLIDFNAPAEFALRQNYPNPFNPTTNIEFRIANFEFVSLKVFDLLGKEVATLVNEEKDAGVYEVNFGSEGLSSGIYLCRLQAGDFVETRKLLLVR